jgi:hypothetical protein
MEIVQAISQYGSESLLIRDGNDLFQLSNIWGFPNDATLSRFPNWAMPLYFPLKLL